MKIALITLHLHPSPPAIPLAAACLAAALPPSLRPGVRLLDLFSGTPVETMREQILAEEWALAAFQIYSWNRRPLLALTRALRRQGSPVRLVAGGPEATADPAGVLAEGELDGVVCGEEETPFARLVEKLAGGGDPAGTPGLLWQSPAGPIAGPPAPAADPETLPSPWLTGVLTPPAGGSVPWEIARGGTLACDLCQETLGSRTLRHLPVGRLQAELDLFARTGVAEVRVLGPPFNFPPERGQQLLRLLAEHAPQIHYLLEARTEFLDRETIRLLSRLSSLVRLDLISARPEVLRRLHRSFDAELFTRQVHLLSSEGVDFSLELFWGLPGDDPAGFRASLEWALELNPKRLDLSPLPLHSNHSLQHHRGEPGLTPPPPPLDQLQQSPVWSPADLETARRLAAATDLFYNIGRAAPFFTPLLQATGDRPAQFLEGFAQWAVTWGDVEESRFLDARGWQPAAVLPLQEAYVAHRLQQRERNHLLAAAHDLIRFHFHLAEMRAGDPTVPPAPETLQGLDFWEIPWRMAPQACLVPFSYEVLDLQELGEVNLEEFASLFRPVGSVAIFLRRDHQVFCESLEENFLRLLQESDGKRSPREIFGGSISPQEGTAIVEFAVGEGFLIRG